MYYLASYQIMDVFFMIENTMKDDLSRQRRNLISISAVLLIFDFANVSIGKVSVLGTELLIGNVKVLMICAWVLWAYFLLRYYQYWREHPDRTLRNIFMNRLHQYIRSHLNTSIFDDYKITYVSLVNWTYTRSDYNSQTNNIALNIKLPVWSLFIWSLKAAAFVCLQTSHATDILFPFIIAIAAPVVSIWGSYNCD